MHLTKLNITNEVSKSVMLNPYEHHRFIWSLFKSEKRDFIFRIKPKARGWEVIILSQTAPTTPSWANKENFRSVEMSNKFFEYNNYQFMIVANPIRAGGGKKHPVMGEDNLNKWISDKGSKHGFSIEQVDILSQSGIPFDKKGKGGVHNVVEFSGILTVTDQSKFFDAVKNGIGSAKAFGYGMLQIIPIASLPLI